MVWESENEGNAGDGAGTKGKHSDSVSFILKYFVFSCANKCVLKT